MKPNPSSLPGRRRRLSGALAAAVSMSSSLLALMAGFTAAVILIWPG